MMTDKHAIYSAWAPADSPWSPWVKAAVFAQIPTELEIIRPLPPPDVSVNLAAEPTRAIVVDLSGPQAVSTGLALAARGYRPVPLFNSCPPSPEDATRICGSAVDAWAILEALVTETTSLEAITLPDAAPPVFLLDAHRSAPGTVVVPRMFDNRSAVFAADFPSTNFLRRQGITRALLIHDPATPIGDDLRHALRHWVADGMPVDTVNSAGEPFDVAWPKGGFWGEIAERFRALFTLRRNPQGGFGRFVSEASGG